MQIIYIHGFKSDHLSVKGQWLEDYCQQHVAHIRVQRPDLNCSPQQAMQRLEQLYQQDTQCAFVGSSLGGFFATACCNRWNAPTVLINPSVYPFRSMRKYFADGQPEFVTPGGWHVTPDQIEGLELLYSNPPVHAEQLLVLLKTADEVLPYQEAEAFYGVTSATVITEAGGDHFMTDFAEKLPLILTFIQNRLT